MAAIAGGVAGRAVKTWNPEKLKTCRAPQPRRFPGFQISRFPPSAPGARPRRPRPPAAPPGRSSRPRWRAGRSHGGGHAPPPSAPQAHTPGHRHDRRVATARRPPRSPRQRRDRPRRLVREQHADVLVVRPLPPRLLHEPLPRELPRPSRGRLHAAGRCSRGSSPSARASR